MILKTFLKFKYPNLFFNKVAGLRLATLLKKRLRHRCFPVNFTKFSKAHSHVWDCYGNWNPFKINMKCFLFQLKSSFCSKDIEVFVLIFRSCRKTAWLKDKFNFKFYKVTAWLTNNCSTHILLSILRRKANETNEISSVSTM